ncbi:ThiF family adenylyltransferase [Defluviimonas salinarum]|uniref:ThiF family adenylyltransferase n=1 Tax=Defluviimonas salinarum TaxID=2992147 RepID=A0ABT3J6A7_9RHOB|nr:ThiF family adenylyltransferase [Defluviimonas salinarum]MCW3783224.1 ThiF family adenylyltransferase [Defluviimonas salinarum]
MKRSDVILQERHRDQIQALLAHPNGIEGAAYVLFGKSDIAVDPWGLHPRTRYMSYEVVEIPQEDRVSASAKHVTWNTNSFARLCRRAKEEGLVPAIVHSHPDGYDGFSRQDDRNERDLFIMARNRNGPGTRLLSILQVGMDLYRARVWEDESHPKPCHRVSCIGSGIIIQDLAEPTPSEFHSRQALAFGPEVNVRLKQLSVAVVGCGGTGSPVVQLLTRLGVGRIVLIDDDIVEHSNLNRLHGATREDADNKVLKVDVMAREATRMGLDVEIRALHGRVDAPHARDALKSCDVIFGCTDDHAGRLFLNRLSHFYLIPVIDVGLVLLPRDGDEPGLLEMAARVSVLFPTTACLTCRGTVDPIRAREEDLRRCNPVEFERQKTEAYVRGAGNPAPAVVTFTTEAATMAVNELLAGLVGFRGSGGWTWQRYRKLDMAIERTQAVQPRAGCPICGKQEYWGLGDVEPFLDRIG